MTDRYCYLRLRAPDRGWQPLAEQLTSRTLPRWRDAELACWGIWQGLFGLASNELLLMGAARGGGPAPFREALPEQAEVVECVELVSTARPRTIRALSQEGLYVFRFFDVAAADFDEVVALSRQAWETFERTDRYVARPEGLFKPQAVAVPDGRQAPDARGNMLLVTWYDGFESWQRSRSPAPEARENFTRRHALTGGTIAYATRMVPHS